MGVRFKVQGLGFKAYGLGSRLDPRNHGSSKGLQYSCISGYRANSSKGSRHKNANNKGIQVPPNSEFE